MLSQNQFFPQSTPLCVKTVTRASRTHHLHQQRPETHGSRSKEELSTDFCVSDIKEDFKPSNISKLFLNQEFNQTKFTNIFVKRSTTEHITLLDIEMHYTV